jgi:NAD(P)H-dependent flavin oxidoreductase YrpB (nitropropane dioxygenase family)
MPLKTKICDLLNIKYPIFQGPMGGAATPNFISAAANAGGLGTLALGSRPLDEARKLIKDTLSVTKNPIAVNLVLEWDQEERLQISLEEGIKTIWFAWGDPSPYIKQIHQVGGRVIHTIGSAEEAKKSVDAGVDILVAQGWEAGGHIWGEVATLPLLPAVVDVAGNIPVVAAGGIADGRGLVAALALGAAGVVLGTRLLASTEAGIHPLYKEKIIHAKETDTIYNDLFDIGWPNSWMRTLRNSTYEKWLEAGSPTPGDRPGEDDVIARLPGKDIPRYSYMLPGANMEGDLEAMALYAGQTVGLILEIKSIANIFDEVTQEALNVILNLQKFT